MFGHSLGGGASLHTCRALPFIRAGINIDGSTDADPTGDERISQPFLTIIAGAEDLSERGWIDGHPTYPQHACASEFKIESAEHNDFSIHALYQAQSNEQEPSPRAMDVYRQTNQLVIKFFSEHLK